MTKMVPYPLLTAGLVLMWLLLNSFSLGHLLLGSAIAIVAGKAMSALEPSPPRIRRWHLIPGLLMVVMGDIVRSNIEVAGVILRGGPSRAGFVEIPLDLRDPSALAILAIIVTSTPGTAWMEYDPPSGILLLHVLDLVDEQTWIETIKGRYERPLREIFE